MLLMTSTSDIIRVVTGTTGSNIQVHASWVDNASGVITPGRTNTAAITTNTTTTVVAAPASGAQRNVKNIHIVNSHATVGTLVTVQHYNGTNSEDLVHVTLAAGEHLIYGEDGHWEHQTAEGAPYSYLPPYATQAEMEAATATDKMVSPGRLKYHPGVAKAVMFTTGTATPVAQTPPTYNCTLTDTGVGQLTVNFTTAFSATTAYCVLVNCEIISTTLTAAANVMQAYMRFGGQAAAGSCQLNCCDRTGTTNVIRDPISWHVAAFGDQA